MNDEGIIQISQRETGSDWNPVQGSELTELVSSNTALSADEKDSLVSETMAIMQSCADPKKPSDHNTGLIIGYVQSGKMDMQSLTREVGMSSRQVERIFR